LRDRQRILGYFQEMQDKIGQFIASMRGKEEEESNE